MFLKKLVNSLPLGLALLAFMFAFGAYIEVRDAQKDTNTLLGDIRQHVNVSDDEVTMEEVKLAADLLNVEAQQAIASAENASNSADAVLGLIESGSILLAALVTAGALVFGLSIQDVRSQLNESLTKGQAVVNQNEQRMLALENQMKDQLDEAKRSDEERLIESKHQLAELQDDMRQQLDLAAKEDYQRLQENEKQFSELQKHIQATLSVTEQKITGFQTLINEAVAVAQKQAENNFRALSLVLLAEQQIRSQNRDTAITTLEQAIPLDITNQTTNYLLGYLYVGRKRFEEALEHLNRALESDANFAPALAAKGLALSRMATQIGDNEMQINQMRAEAEYNLTKALGFDSSLLDGDDESYFGSLGGVYRRQGRLEDAVRAYERAVEVTPNNSYPVGNLSMLYKRIGREKEAQETFQKVVKLAKKKLEEIPGDIWSRFDLAQALLVTGEVDEALSEYKVAFGHVTSQGEIEAALSGIRTLQGTPQPPEGIEQVIALLEKQISDFQA